MSRFTSALHPRDRNGKFSRKGGGNRSKSLTARAGRVGRSVSAGRGRTVASATPTKHPLAGSRREGSAPVNRQAAISRNITSGVAIATGGRATFTLGASAVAAAGLGHYPLAGLLGARAGITAARTVNEVHRVRTITSKQYVEGSVSEKSKFDLGYAKRTKVLNHAQSATDVVGTAAVVANLGYPALKQQVLLRQGRVHMKNKQTAAADESFATATKRTYKGGSAVVSYTGANATPKLAKPKRNGVYDITTAGGKRVA